MNALFTEEAKRNLRSRCFFLESVGNLAKCPAAHPLPVAIQGAQPWWQRQGFARRTGSWFIAITGARGAVSMPRWASTNHGSGARCGLPSCVSTRCVAGVAPRAYWCQPVSWITFGPSKTVAYGLTQPTCSRYACPVTTARPHASQRRGRVPPGGDESLRLASRDALACPNFSACKL